MALVTVFRHVPKPIVGMVNVVPDRDFALLEECLDWLETTGILVERFDPAVALDEVARRPKAQQLLREGDRCLPLIFLDDDLILQGLYPSHTALAHALARAKTTSPETDRPAA